MLCAAVRQATPKDAEEVISYGIVALRTDRVLVWYAAFAQHCSLFPTASVLGQFGDELKGYKVSKGTVQFPVDDSPPAALVKKLVRARVAEAREEEEERSGLLRGTQEHLADEGLRGLGNEGRDDGGDVVGLEHFCGVLAAVWPPPKWVLMEPGAMTLRDFCVGGVFRRRSK